MNRDWIPENTPEILLEPDAIGAPDWLSDEECLHEIGSDWCRRHCEYGEGNDEWA